MKKKLPLILLLGCGVLVAIGVYAAMHGRASDSDSATSAREIHTTASSLNADDPGHPSGVNADKSLNVGMPAATPSQVKDYEGFRVSFNKENLTPNWVAWELLASETEGSVKRESQFWQDTDIEGCPTTYDYSRSGYDRGHLCPAADQKWSPRAMTDCFSLANITPQDHNLNTGAWKTLENKERVWAKRDSALVIVAGPIYEKSDKKRIGESGVRVPGAFFKVLAAPYLDSPLGIAFVYPNMTAPGNMEKYAMSIRELEQLTGYDFFTDLPRDLQDKIETSASFREWNRR